MIRLAIGAGLDQIRGRPAVDKLLMRRNSGSSLALPAGAGLDKLAIVAGLHQGSMLIILVLKL